MPEKPPTFAQEDMVAQSVMALGQGAGTMLATPAALRLAQNAYARMLKGDNWHLDAPVVLEFARAVGRVAAHLAVHSGGTVIDRDDMGKAIELVRGRQMWPCFCPYCPPVHDWNRIIHDQNP
jgi:hypothetical protein